tara:strand:+ start:466 stop:732 length:267 start_codon:yes stop_codon:yes gene_type:complete
VAFGVEKQFYEGNKMKIRAYFKCEDCNGNGFHIVGSNWETEGCTTCGGKKVPSGITHGTGNGEAFTIECNSIEDVARKFPNAQSFTYL